MTTRTAARRRAGTTPVEVEIAQLRTLTVAELQEKYAGLFGHESRSHNRDYLWKKIAWKVQEVREGGLDDATRDKAAELARGATLRTRAPRAAPEPAEAAHPSDPRLPRPGTILRKEHNGVVHEITVLEDGFEYAGARYRSLSRIAKEVTGTSWNGFLWVGLVKRTKTTKES